MENLKMKRNEVFKTSFIEADNHVSFYENKTPLQRLQDACYIINHIFQVAPTHKVDRAILTTKKHAKSV